MTEDEIRQALRRLAMGLVNHPEVEALVQLLVRLSLDKPADSVAQSRKRKS